MDLHKLKKQMIIKFGLKVLSGLIKVPLVINKKTHHHYICIFIVMAMEIIKTTILYP